MPTTKIVVADTETASIKGGVCDLAVVEIDEELNVIKETEVLLDPVVKITPAAQAVHGISKEMVADAPTMAEFIERDGNPFLGADNLIIIGHNVQFDCRMLGDVLPEQYTKVCTLKLSRIVWPDLDPEEANYKLGTLAVLFGLKTGTAHRAMGDVVTCLNLLRHIVAVSGVGSFGELVAMSQKNPITVESKLGFGSKHRDDKIKNVPRSYLQWMLKNVTDLDPDLREVITPLA